MRFSTILTAVLSVTALGALAAPVVQRAGDVSIGSGNGDGALSPIFSGDGSSDGDNDGDASDFLNGATAGDGSGSNDGNGNTGNGDDNGNGDGTAEGLSGAVAGLEALAGM